MIEALLRRAMEGGADLAGWAAFDRGELALYSLLDAEQAQRYHSAFVITKSHIPEVLKGLDGVPTQRYDQDYRRLNVELYDLARSLESFLKSRGIAARAVHPSETLDTRTQRGLVSHKALAERAGLGIRGRNNLLVTYPYHSGVRLCSVLTELKVPQLSRPVWPNPCADCDNCFQVCPVKAVGDTSEQYQLDLCLAHLEDVQTDAISKQICGACLAACPLSYQG
jgi:epoxyqueuosine reductase QueG